MITSLPSPLVGSAPEKITRPVSGAVLYSLSLCIVLVRASCTWFRVVSDFMFPAVPHSSLRFEITS